MCTRRRSSKSLPSTSDEPPPVYPSVPDLSGSSLDPVTGPFSGLVYTTPTLDLGIVLGFYVHSDSVRLWCEVVVPVVVTSVVKGRRMRNIL